LKLKHIDVAHITLPFSFRQFELFLLQVSDETTGARAVRELFLEGLSPG
jgi:hypothetical protein